MKDDFDFQDYNEDDDFDTPELDDLDSPEYEFVEKKIIEKTREIEEELKK